MTPWQRFKRDVLGKPIRVTRRDYDWVFHFGEGLSLNVAALWRIRARDQIRLTADDDGHQYGLPTPVDAEEWAKGLLQGATVESLESDASSADLTVQLSNGLLIEVLTNSSGYESWQAYIESELAAVGRNGD